MVNRGSFGPNRPAQHGGARFGSPPEAADPLRPSAERAGPDVVTSGALCRDDGASPGSPHRTSGARLTCVGTHPIPPRQDRWPRRRFRATKHHDPERLPSGRCPTSLPGRARSYGLFGSHALTQHPCRPKRSAPPSRRTGRSVLLTAPFIALAGHESSQREGTSSPTSATDLRHEHPQKPPDSRPLGAFRRFGTGRSTVDAVLPASGGLSNALFPLWGGEERRTERRFPVGGLFGRSPGSQPDPLTPPVTIRRHRQRRSPRTARIAFPEPSSKGPASTTQSAFHRQVLPRGALARFPGEPSPSSRFCHREPASGLL
jgi:hypothetical protein